jgi:hypothetical protein
MRFILIFILLGLLVNSNWAMDLDKACPSIQLPPSHLIKERQPDAGMCYAYRDTKTMQYLLNSLIKTEHLQYLSVQRHQKCLF